MNKWKFIENDIIRKICIADGHGILTYPALGSFIWSLHDFSLDDIVLFLVFTTITFFKSASASRSFS